MWPPTFSGMWGRNKVHGSSTLFRSYHAIKTALDELGSDAKVLGVGLGNESRDYGGP